MRRMGGGCFGEEVGCSYVGEVKGSIFICLCWGFFLGGGGWKDVGVGKFNSFLNLFGFYFK